LLFERDFPSFARISKLMHSGLIRRKLRFRHGERDFVVRWRFPKRFMHQQADALRLFWGKGSFRHREEILLLKRDFVSFARISKLMHSGFFGGSEVSGTGKRSCD